MNRSTDLSPRCTDLQAEVQYLHAQFFKMSAPPEVVQRYVAANRLCLPALDEPSKCIVDTVLARRLDAEAVEFALRLRRYNPILTRKVQILFYLVEVRSAYYTYFVNNRAGSVRASVALVFGTVRTVWKLIKGMYLIWRYGLV